MFKMNPDWYYLLFDFYYAKKGESRREDIFCSGNNNLSRDDEENIRIFERDYKISPNLSRYSNRVPKQFSIHYIRSIFRFGLLYRGARQNGWKGEKIENFCETDLDNLQRKRNSVKR